MKLITWNVNGLRAAAAKGFARWFREQRADVVCLQEVRARPDQLPEVLRNPEGYHGAWHPAEKLGYSGVAMFFRKEPLAVTPGLGDSAIDAEGRVLCADFGHFVLINAYFPNSQRDHARLPYKLRFCQRLHEHADIQRAKGKDVLVCGDFNIAHEERDLANPKTNRSNAGFLPEERAWMDRFLARGYLDAFRHFISEGGHYTWWSQRPGVRARNIGWRLDGFLASETLADRLRRVVHQTQVMASDHCPVALELKR